MIKAKKFGYILILISFLFACKSSTEYPGYKPYKQGIYFKLEKIGEDTKRAKYGNYVTADIEYRTIKDSLFFKGRRRLQLRKPAHKGSIEVCFRKLAQNEKAIFILPAENFFTKTLETNIPDFIAPGEMMKISIEIIDIQTQHEYKREKEAFLSWINDFSEYEQTILKQYLQHNDISIKSTESGIYYIPVRSGNGRKIKKGDTLTINYEGRFLNGKFFDSTIKRKQPFSFVFGTEWQVVEGLEEAISMMEEQEKALFIIPSDLAFGQTGSSTGIIPPFTSLIFEVEILKVN